MVLKLEILRYLFVNQLIYGSKQKKPKNQQELKKFKTVTLLRANVPRDRIMGIVNISKRTFFCIKKDCKRRRIWLRKQGSQSISVLQKNDKLRIHNHVARNPFVSLRDIVKTLKLKCSHQTIGRYLKRAGFVRRKPQSTLDLTPHHIQLRYDWSFHMRKLRFRENWCLQRSSFWLNDNGHLGWFHKGLSHDLSMDKHSGKCHVWGAFSCLEK